MQRDGRSDGFGGDSKRAGPQPGFFEFFQRRKERRALRRYETFSPQHYTVLVVESDHAQRDRVSELLRSVGFRVAATCSAAEGLALMVRRFVDLVVCGSHLPDMSGCEMSRSLKSLRCVPQHCPIPVILVSDENEASTTAALRSGADLVCLKEKTHSMLVSQVLFLLQ